MMRRLLFIFTTLLALLGNAKVLIDSETALQLVKDLQTDTLPKSYRVFAVDSLEHDSLICAIPSWPTDAWAQDGVTKWLVFVDHQPTNMMWAHPCTYYYLPKTAASFSEIPILAYNGQFPPPGDSFLYDSDIQFAPSVAPDGPQTWDAFVTDEMNLFEFADNDVFVVMIAGGSHRDTNNWSFYNNTAELYQTLTQKLRIPKEKIFVHLGSGGFPNDVSTDELSVYSTMPMDLDGDGVWDVCGQSNKYAIAETFRNLSIYGCTESSHLFVFIDTHGGIGDDGRSGICLWQGAVAKVKLTYAETINAWLASSPSRYQTILIGSCHGGGLVEELADTSRVVMSAVSADELAHTGWVNPGGFEFIDKTAIYGMFLHKWTNAVRGFDYYGNPVNADLNGDKQISMLEAFEYASGEDNFELDYPMEYSPEHPIYSSPTAWLGDELTFRYIPGDEELFIRDNPVDSGLHYNSTTNVVWNSPDIWLRNQADGLVNMNHEQPRLTADGKVYIYTRVHNRGHKDFNDSSRRLHLYWAPAALGLGNTTLYSSSGLGGTIAQPLIPDIAQDTSVVIETEWVLPESLIRLAQLYGGVLPVSVLAGVSDNDVFMSSPVSMTGMVTHVERSNRMAIHKQLVACPDNGETVQSSNPQALPSRQVRIPVYIQNPGVSTAGFDIRIGGDTLDAAHSAFSRADIGLELSPNLLASWQQNGQNGDSISTNAMEPNRIRLLSENSRVGGITLVPGQLDSLILTIRKPMALSFTDSTSHNFNICLIDSAGSVCDAMAVLTVIPGQQQGGGDGPPLGPMLLSVSNNPGSGQVNVELTAAALENTSIAVQPTLSLGATTVVAVPEGGSSATVSTSRLPEGPFIITLQQGGTVIDARQLVK